MLRGSGVKPFIYQHDLLPSRQIKEAVRQAIEECDAFVPLISPDSMNSSWVAREIAFAKHLQRIREQEYPIIVPIYTRGQKPGRIRLRNFESGWLSWATYDLGECRGVSRDSPHTDSIELIVRLLKPDVRYYGEERGDIDEVPEDLFEELYKKLFPKASERDEPYKIRHWINEAASLGDASPWAELFATITIAGRPAGFAWLSAHRESGYVFGNYFGMDLVWRKYKRAEYLLDHLETYAARRCPNAKGILFEVEPYDKRVVAGLLRRLRSKSGGKLKLNASERETVRALRRLALYLDHPAKSSRTFTSDDGEPMRYRQPAMSAPFKEKNEVELILMMRPLSKAARESDYSAQEIMDFLYDDLFGDAYEEESGVGMKGYRVYLEQLKAKVLAQNQTRLKLRHLLGDDEKRLLYELRKAKIVVPL